MEKPIRVLHILQRMEAGGVQTFLMNMYRLIDMNKVQFDFLVFYKEKEFYDDEISMLGGNVYKLSVRENFNVAKYKKEIKDFFEKHKEYYIVHAHMETLSNIWEKEAKKAGIPNIICHAHTGGYNEKNYLKLLIKYYFKYNYGRYSTMRFACSDVAGKFMFPNKTYKLVNNAIDVEKFKFSQNQRYEIRNAYNLTNEIVIGNVGRLHHSKNQLFLVEIAHELKKMGIDAKTLIIGDGELKSELESKIEEYDLIENVRLLGKRTDVNLFYSAIDFFIMPSLYEGLPLTGVEAQASGARCIFSDGITKELKLSDLVTFISLDKPAKFWADSIVELAKLQTVDRNLYAKIISSKGYNIRDLSSEMMKYYLSLEKEGLRDE